MIRPVIPLLLAGTGALALVAGWISMQRLGPRARIGRILAATPVVDVSTARGIAVAGRIRYVGVLGRVDSDEEFEDEHHRPLVLRRTRLETLGPSGWVAAEDVLETVPFQLTEGLESIAIDGHDLDAGLVTVVREAEGTAREIPDRLPAGTPPDARARLRIEHLSSVDHALALGVPVADPERGPMLRPGLGRPLVLTNLERDEAMRLLASGRRGTAMLASALLATGVLLVGLGVAWLVVDALVG
jgi:hypothetical protein